MGGNLALRGYKKFAMRIATEHPHWFVNMHQMRDTTKDNQGNYHDEYVFEIVKSGE